MDAITGIHHVGAIAADLQTTLNFYTNVLGMTLIARTVDFDRPDVLQLYCGGMRIASGSLLGFQIHPGLERGRGGLGQVSAVSFAVPGGSLPAWRRRLAGHGVNVLGRAWSFREEHLCFNDPDGLELSLVEEVEAGGARRVQVSRRPARGPGIIRIKAIEVHVEAMASAAGFLVDGLGFRQWRHDGAATRFRVGDGAGQASIDIIVTPGTSRGVDGAGVVSHVALSVSDVASIERMSAALAARGTAITPVVDRLFFRAAYFEALGGIRLALATDDPGFPRHDGSGISPSELSLPAWLEADRTLIERRLRVRATRGE